MVGDSEGSPDSVRVIGSGRGPLAWIFLFPTAGFAWGVSGGSFCSALGMGRGRRKLTVLSLTFALHSD